MNNIIFKRINEDDEKQVRTLVNSVFESLEREDFLIPWTEEQMARFFDEEYSFLLGAYDNNKLIAMSQIFTPKEIEEEYYNILNISKSKSICELGGFLVLPKYRKKGIMQKLAEMSCELINELNFDYIISTVHPENIASNKIVQKLGFDLYVTLTTQTGFLRNLYWKNQNNIDKDVKDK